MSHQIPSLIAALIDTYVGQPALVIGGGPSVTTDLPKIPLTWAPRVVLSANQHGYYQSRFTVNYMVNVDKLHSREQVPMREYLRRWPGRIINKFSWADYRLCNWTFGGNSGLTAIAVAAALGCDPIVVLGIDLLWPPEKPYFHDGCTKRPDLGRRGAATVIRKAITVDQRTRVQLIERWCRGSNVRPISGPLLTQFPPFDPAETLPSRADNPYRTGLRTHHTVRVVVQKSHLWEHRDMALRGQTIALTEGEARRRCASGLVRRVPELT